MLWCLSSRSLLGPSINVASPIPDIGQSQSMSGLALQGEATTLVYRASHHQVQKVNWQQVESLTIVDKSLTVVVQLWFSKLMLFTVPVARASIWRYDIGIMTINREYVNCFWGEVLAQSSLRFAPWKGFRGQSCASGPHASAVGSARESPGKHSPRCDLPSTLDDETARRIAALQGCTTSQQDFGYGEVAWIARGVEQRHSPNHFLSKHMIYFPRKHLP